ncbi:MAG: biopolymer transporter ExbD [Planctomycetes bacterium]|nr:biopolymer transporter ExbD [Planctomycetota bacterium]
MTRTKAYQAQEANMELNMTPMIDVIFQLIIFFMCSIHFKSLEGKLYAYLPPEGRIPSQVFIPPIPEVRIRLVYSEESPILARVKLGEIDFKDWNSLERHLKDLAPNLVSPDGLDVIPVKIDADGNVPAQAVVSVLDICKKAGVQKTEFAAKASPGQSAK